MTVSRYFTDLNRILIDVDSRGVLKGLDSLNQIFLSLTIMQGYQVSQISVSLTKLTFFSRSHLKMRKTH